MSIEQVGVVTSRRRNADATARSHPGTSLAWDAARERAFAAVAASPPEWAPLATAAGAVLAAPLVAQAPVPPVDRSAMDGYAVSGRAPWTIVGAVRAGSRGGPALRSGQACAVVTGATVPDGTDAVLPDEDAVRTRDGLTGTVARGRHIRHAGEECAAGEELAPAGAVVDPPLLGLAATLGHDTLSVRPRPRVAGFVTGDELTEHGSPGRGRVRDAIGPMLPGLVQRAGGHLVGATRLPDTRAALLDALAGTDADLVLVSGSSAAGPADHLRAVLTELGAELLVDGVRCRPGHPQMLARLPCGPLAVGLPGNPLAALAAFLTLAAPALNGLRGEELPALLAVPVPGGTDRHPTSTRLVPVRVGPHGAHIVGHAGSAMLRGAALADALAVVDPGPAAAIAARLLPLDPGARPWAV